jgi:hypothetical protein
MTAPDFREAAIAEFKREWHAADERGEVGGRTKAGIDAVLALLAERLGGDGVREAVCSAICGPRGNGWSSCLPDDEERKATAALAAVRAELGVQG